jgi:hypothetical protein
MYIYIYIIWHHIRNERVTMLKPIYTRTRKQMFTYIHTYIWQHIYTTYLLRHRICSKLVGDDEGHVADRCDVKIGECLFNECMYEGMYFTMDICACMRVYVCSCFDVVRVCDYYGMYIRMYAQ